MSQEEIMAILESGAFECWCCEGMTVQCILVCCN